MKLEVTRNSKLRPKPESSLETAIRDPKPQRVSKKLQKSSGKDRKVIVSTGYQKMPISFFVGLYAVIKAGHTH